MEDKVRVTVIATGFGDRSADQAGTTTVSAPQLSSSGSVQLGLTSQVAISRDPIANPPGILSRKSREPAPEVIKLKKLSVLSSAEDDEKYEIPTFLRRQAE
jgi:hypothetical protein